MKTIDVQTVLLAMAEVSWNRYVVFESFGVEAIAFYFDGFIDGAIYVKAGGLEHKFFVYRVVGNRVRTLEGTDVRAMVQRLLIAPEDTNSWE